MKAYNKEWEGGHPNKFDRMYLEAKNEIHRPGPTVGQEWSNWVYKNYWKNENEKCQLKFDLCLM